MEKISGRQSQILHRPHPTISIYGICLSLEHSDKSGKIFINLEYLYVGKELQENKHNNLIQYNYYYLKQMKIDQQ